jgi:hypothetical protein
LGKKVGRSLVGISLMISATPRNRLPKHLSVLDSNANLEVIIQHLTHSRIGFLIYALDSVFKSPKKTKEEENKSPPVSILTVFVDYLPRGWLVLCYQLNETDTKKPPQNSQTQRSGVERV